MKCESKLEGRKGLGVCEVTILLQNPYKLVVQLLFCLQVCESAIGNAIEEWKVGGGVLEGSSFSGVTLEALRVRKEFDVQ